MRDFILIVAMLLFIVIMSCFFIKFGWSLSMVPIFGLKELTYSEALGLLILSDTLFKTGGKVKDLVKGS